MFQPTAITTKMNRPDPNWLSLICQTGSGEPEFKFTQPPKSSSIQNPNAAHWRLNNSRPKIFGIKYNTAAKPRQPIQICSKLVAAQWPTGICAAPRTGAAASSQCAVPTIHGKATNAAIKYHVLG